MKKHQNILISRTDRLGDVLMSLQAVNSVRKALPGSHIHFLVREEVVPVLAPLMENWGVELKAFRPDFSFAGYDAALCLFDEPNLLVALKKAKVPVRVGNFSKLRSFLSLTHGIRQRRALGKKSEGEYNLELSRIFLTALGLNPKYDVEPVVLPTNSSAKEEAQRALRRIGIEPGMPYWVAHPGMGGSALNLGVRGYIQLLDTLAPKFKGPLVLTLGPAMADLHQVEAIIDERPDWRVLPAVSLAAVGEVFRVAELVVAPSTGPLHLAHYSGAPTLGIYSPVRSHQPKRWAPWGGGGRSTVLAPTHTCPGTRKCLGKRCKHYYCLDRMVEAGLPSTVQSALTATGA